MKRVFALLIVISTAFALYGCQPGTDMPYNGNVSFHAVMVSVPEDFIRDSTRSNSDLWRFEKGFYDQIIILSRNDIVGDVSASLDSYLAYMIEQGCESNRTTFMQLDAVHSTYTQNDQYCQEMLFAYHGSLYAIALRGGTEEDFQSLLDSVILAAA